MSLNRFRTQLVSRIKLLNMLIAQKESAVKKAPSGKMIVSSHANVQYFMVNEENNERIYISKSNIDLIKRLAQKSYDENVLKNAIKERKILERLLKNYPDTTMEEYYETLDVKRRKLVAPVWLPDDEYIRKWQEKPFIRKKCDDIEKCFLTNRGEYVRSKSEKIIADRLYERNIPYRYEAELVLNSGDVVHPDFTLLNMKTRTEVYLEHCGMMDNPGYANSTVKRIRLFSRNGIVVGDKLWLTFETEQIPLDVSVLDAVINKALGLS